MESENAAVLVGDVAKTQETIAVHRAGLVVEIMVTSTAVRLDKFATAGGNVKMLLADTSHQLTANWGVGEHGTPALKYVMGACRTQPGLSFNKPKVEGNPVLGSQRGPNTVMNYPVLQKKVRVKCI